MKATLLFYRSFCFTSIFISLINCFLLSQSNLIYFAFALFPSKVITNILIGIFLNMFQSQQLNFYCNLGMSKVVLLGLSFLFDMVVWTILILLTITFLV